MFGSVGKGCEVLTSLFMRDRAWAGCANKTIEKNPFSIDLTLQTVGAKFFEGFDLLCFGMG